MCYVQTLVCLFHALASLESIWLGRCSELQTIYCRTGLVSECHYHSVPYDLGEALVLQLWGKKAEELAERDAASVTDEHWTSQFKTLQEACAGNGALGGAQWFAAVKKRNEELLDDETKRWNVYMF